MLMLPLSLLFSACDDESTEATTFFNFTSPDFYLNGPTNYYYAWITDESGQTIAAKEFLPGAAVKFDTPDGHQSGDLYNVTVVEFFETPDPTDNRNNLPYLVLHTYTEIEPGEYELVNEKINGDETNAGIFSLTIQNYPTTFPYYIVTSGRNVSYASNFGIVAVAQPFRAQLTASSADIFYLLRSSPSADYLSIFLPDMNAGVSTTIDNNQLESPSSVVYQITESSSVGGTLWGIPEEGAYDDAFIIYDETQEIFLPSTNSTTLYYSSHMNYPEYITELAWAEPSGGSGRYRLVGDEPAPTVKRLDANISSLIASGDSYTLQTSGSFDFSILYSSEILGDISNPEGYLFWQVYLPGSTSTSFVKPEFPSEITTGEYGAIIPLFDMKFNGVEIVDYTTMAGYSDFIQSTLNSGSQHIDAIHKERLAKRKTF
ncbi:MAG: hypothetical protein R2820_12195 [Cyclobacteriaceae bacterium]|nr:hypothetical protein [Cyclobacteriaceae bacterium]